MSYLSDISSECFDESFKLERILENSAFYPASGIGKSYIERLIEFGINSFVHVDCSSESAEVKHRLENDFSEIGYQVVGISFIPAKKLTPHCCSYIEKNPTDIHEESDSAGMGCSNVSKKAGKFKHFAIWAVFEFDKSYKGARIGKTHRFSMLHIGSEACATFESLYTRTKLNPSAVVIIDSLKGLRNGRASLAEPDSCMHQMILSNKVKYNLSMPKFLMTNGDFRNENPVSDWPNYTFKERCYSKEVGWLNLFVRDGEVHIPKLDFDVL